MPSVVANSLSQAEAQSGEHDAVQDGHDRDERHGLIADRPVKIRGISCFSARRSLFVATSV
jgi:hypothetical protein